MLYTVTVEEMLESDTYFLHFCYFLLCFCSNLRNNKTKKNETAVDVVSCQPLIIHKFLNNNLKRIFMYTLIHKEKYLISVIKFSILCCAIQYSLM